MRNWFSSTSCLRLTLKISFLSIKSHIFCCNKLHYFSKERLAQNSVTNFSFPYCGCAQAGNGTICFALLCTLTPPGRDLNPTQAGICPIACMPPLGGDQRKSHDSPQPWYSHPGGGMGQDRIPAQAGLVPICHFR